MRMLLCTALVAACLLGQTAAAALVITEVASTSGAPAGPLSGLDWWELTNTGPGSVLLDGYEWEDNNPQGAGLDTAVFPTGITITADESIIIHQGDMSVVAAFRSDWGLSSSVQILYEDLFGGNNTFSGLSNSGDEVHLYNAMGSEVASASFPSATAGVSFEWNRQRVSLGLSVNGENGAYTASNGRVGSPGSAVPEPATILLGTMTLCAVAGCGLRRRR